ncbi:DNA primase [Fulvivirga sp. M361]|uniref:DNA primase n=1 Tax=Fulvivirga sp. M361 TaxID=2594266 RepID=UPI00117B4906|nr:DNA primase [Fulvivirga sp. M361]TRX61703.1 DNA primase [Fulvivirga sp. M361]
MISQHTIQLVKDRMDIEEVVSDYVSLKRKGQNLWACCPFHDEKTPSFSVAPHKGIYKCFGCGKAGDSISFIEEHDGLNYLEAIRHLAGKYGIEIEETEQSDEQIEAQNEKDSLLIVLGFAKDHYRNLLTQSVEGKSIGGSYFRERGFTEQIIEKFELGYSLDQWDGFTKEALSKAYSEDLLEKAGLLVKKENGRQYDRFRGRVIFPIHNVSGKVVAFGARTLKKEDKPKYLNSPESDVYHKSKVLYGLFQAKQAIRQHDNCYLVEGYTDVISLHQSDIENVVASSGTSLTTDQIKLISRFSNNITVLFDGDAAGLRASLRGIDMILEAGMNVRVVVFPEGEDPDSYSRKLGTTAFNTYLNAESQDFISFKVTLFAKEAANDPVKKADAIKEVIQSIGVIPDPIKRAVYLKDSSKLLDMDESLLVAELNKLLIQKRRTNQKKEDRLAHETPSSEVIPELKEKSFDPDDSIVAQERESIRLLLNYGNEDLEEDYKLKDYLIEELREIEFITPIFKTIFEIFQEQHASGNMIDSQYFIRNASNEIKKEVIDLTAVRREVSPIWTDKHQIQIPHEQDFLDHTVYQNITRLKRNIVQKLIEENKENLRDVTDPLEMDRLFEIQKKLKASEMELSKVLGTVIPK